MTHANDVLFNADVWTPALEKFAAAPHLTLRVYDGNNGIAVGPIGPTPLFELLAQHAYDPGIFDECARRCLAQTALRPAIVLAPAYGLAVVGTSLVLDGLIVGAAVAGYALADFAQRSEIERLAKAGGIPFESLWQVARLLQPVPERRLVLPGNCCRCWATRCCARSNGRWSSNNLPPPWPRHPAPKMNFLRFSRTSCGRR
jgi:hypothetical protein